MVDGSTSVEIGFLTENKDIISDLPLDSGYPLGDILNVFLNDYISCLLSNFFFSFLIFCQKGKKQLAYPPPAPTHY